MLTFICSHFFVFCFSVYFHVNQPILLCDLSYSMFVGKVVEFLTAKKSSKLVLFSNLALVLHFLFHNDLRSQWSKKKVDHFGEPESGNSQPELLIRQLSSKFHRSYAVYIYNLLIQVHLGRRYMCSSSKRGQRRNRSK